MWKVTEGPDPPELLAAYMRWVLGTSELYAYVKADHTVGAQILSYKHMPDYFKPWPKLKQELLRYYESISEAPNVEAN